MSEKKSERVHIALESEELSAIDDFRFKERIGSRSEAIRMLIERGLAASSSTNSIAWSMDGDKLLLQSAQEVRPEDQPRITALCQEQIAHIDALRSEISDNAHPFLCRAISRYRDALLTENWAGMDAIGRTLRILIEKEPKGQDNPELDPLHRASLDDILNRHWMIFELFPDHIQRNSEKEALISYEPMPWLASDMTETPTHNPRELRKFVAGFASLLSQAVGAGLIDASFIKTLLNKKKSEN